MPYHVYLLQNPAGRYYLGHTDDLERRVTQYNSPEGKECRGVDMVEFTVEDDGMKDGRASSGSGMANEEPVFNSQFSWSQGPSGDELAFGEIGRRASLRQSACHDSFSKVILLLCEV